MPVSDLDNQFSVRTIMCSEASAHVDWNISQCHNNGNTQPNVFLYLIRSEARCVKHWEWRMDSSLVQAAHFLKWLQAKHVKGFYKHNFPQWWHLWQATILLFNHLPSMILICRSQAQTCIAIWLCWNKQCSQTANRFSVQRVVIMIFSSFIVQTSHLNRVLQSIIL